MASETRGNGIETVNEYVWLCSWSIEIEGTQGAVEKKPGRELARNIRSENKKPSVYWAKHYRKNRRGPELWEDKGLNERCDVGRHLCIVN